MTEIRLFPYSPSGKGKKMDSGAKPPERHIAT